MDVLTRETPKPALPFAGSYALIDFPMSNLRNSGISDVWLSVQYLGQELADAVANGKPWDFDRHHGGFRLLLPQQGSGAASEEGFVSGNAEQLLADRDAIRRHDPDVVLVLSADHIYRLDFRAVIDQHLERDAECTVVTTEVAYKPERAASGQVATEVFAYAPGPLIEVLEQLHHDLAQDPSDDEDAADGSLLGDFGEHLLPALVARGRTHGYPLSGYWRDVGRPEAYFAAHRDLLRSDLGLFEADWPILTNSSRHLAAHLHPTASVSNSLVSAECQIYGTVRDSVLGPGVTVAAGAVVHDCVVFADTVIEADAVVGYSIIDRGARIGAGARVGRRTPLEQVGLDDLTMLGRDCVVAPGVTLRRGARLEPGTIA